MKNFNLPQAILLSLEQMKITSPTEIQKQAIPIAIAAPYRTCGL